MSLLGSTIGVTSNLGGLLDNLRSGFLASEHICCLVRLHRTIADAKVYQAGLLALSLPVQGHDGSNAHQGKIVVAAGHFQEGPSAALAA